MKTRFLLSGTVIFLSVLTFCAASAALPFYVRLSFTSDTSTSITVTWNTPEQAGTTVRYGTSPGNYPDTATGTSFEADAEQFGHIHSVTLTGLDPSTTYYYAAGDDEDGFSPEYEFTTGPPPDENCGVFKFTYLGDNRPDATFGAGQNWDQILDQSWNHSPNFVLNGGDLVIDGEDIEGWIKFMAWTSNVSARAAFMPAIGNHDTGPGEGDTANYNQLFTLPRSTCDHGSDTEDYYYFTFGNAVFVSLSTETFEQGDIPFQDQADWLDGVLTRNPAKWKIVYLHKPIYTQEVLFEISHKPNEEEQNEALVPVMDEHHVDLVITSHNHWYERFHPSACADMGDPASDQACSTGAGNFEEGTVYMVSGGAGAFTIPGLLCGFEPGRARCSGEHHYLFFSIENEVLTMETWAAYPQANDIIDSITIVKEKDECKPVDADAGADADTDSDTDTDTDTDVDTDADQDTDGGSYINAPDEKEDGGVSEESGSASCGCSTPGARSDTWSGWDMLQNLLPNLSHSFRFVNPWFIVPLKQSIYSAM